jgi:hypothetical protein
VCSVESVRGIPRNVLRAFAEILQQGGNNRFLEQSCLLTSMVRPVARVQGVIREQKSL